MTSQDCTNLQFHTNTIKEQTISFRRHFIITNKKKVIFNLSQKMKRNTTIEELQTFIDIESAPIISKPSPSDDHVQKRQMSRNQEVWNAVTMLVSPGFGLYFVLSGQWVMEEHISQARETLLSENSSSIPEIFMFPFENQDKCISSNVFRNLHSIPPFAAICIFLGLLLHSPCSMYYHLLCAFKLQSGPERLHHWSRRLDQAMIHIMGVFIAYGITGSLKYCLGTLMFALDSAFRLFKPGFKPKWNQARMLVSMLLTAVPVCLNGDDGEGKKLFAIYAIGSWLFLCYPFGGYSHGFFHIVLAMAPPLQLNMSTRLVISQEAIDLAAKCAVFAESLGKNFY